MPSCPGQAPTRPGAAAWRRGCGEQGARGHQHGRTAPERVRLVRHSMQRCPSLAMPLAQAPCHLPHHHSPTSPPPPPRLVRQKGLTDALLKAQRRVGHVFWVAEQQLGREDCSERGRNNASQSSRAPKHRLLRSHQGKRAGGGACGVTLGAARVDLSTLASRVLVELSAALGGAG